jgi:hypothetical protein
MPRHPPCALHSLSHKHSTKTTTTKTNPKNKALRVDKRDNPMVRSCREDARVHYPVHKMPAHQPGHTPRGAPARRRLGFSALRLIPQSSTVCQGRLRAPPTPGSTPGPHPHQRREHRARAVLRSRRPQRRSFIDDSTSEHHHCHPLGRRVRGACAP